jgi:hypothetical protein
VACDRMALNGAGWRGGVWESELHEIFLSGLGMLIYPSLLFLFCF